MFKFKKSFLETSGYSFQTRLTAWPSPKGLEPGKGMLPAYFIPVVGLFMVLVAMSFLLSGSNIILPPSGSTSPAVPLEEITTLTDSTGAFVFSDLERATHPVWIDLESLSAILGREVTSDIELIINPGQSLSTSVEGIGLSATYDEAGTTINGYTWYDLNGDGQLDADESVIPNLKVIDPGIHVYYVPFDDDFLSNSFYEQMDIASCTPNQDYIDPAQGTRSVVSITRGAGIAEWFYDHWEDGYEADPINPTQSSSSSGVLDGVTPDRNYAVFTSINAATASPTNTPANPDNSLFAYDGRDRIVVIGEPVNVVRIAMAEDVSNNNNQFDPALTAMAAEAGEVADWGTNFTFVWGVDLSEAPNLNPDFSQVAPFIMAASNNTTVTVDPDGTGAATQVYNLNQGEVIDPAQIGRIESTGTVEANGPLQVTIAINNCVDFFGIRAMNLVPTNQWINDYYSPIPSFPLAGCTDNTNTNNQVNRAVITEYQIHNPDLVNDIVVRHNGNGGPGTISVPAGKTVTFAVGDNQQGVRFYTDNPTDDFYVTAVVDRGFGAHDWGFSLIPGDQLTSQTVVGWSDGERTTPPNLPVNLYSLAWLTPVVNATIFVDRDSDGTADPFDTNGDGIVEPGSENGVAVNALELLRISDPNDNSLQGDSIYAENYSERFALVFGQDPCLSPEGGTALDLGFTVRPLPISTMIKTDKLFVDADGDTHQSPGDTIEWTIVFNNSGRGNMVSVVLTDVLNFLDSSNTCSVAPDGSGTGDCADWVPLSLDIVPSLGSPSDSTLYGTTQNPADITGLADSTDTEAFKITWPSILPSETVTVTFQTKFADDLPLELTSVANQSTLQAEGVGPITSIDPDDPTDPDTDTPIGQPYLEVIKYHLADDFADTVQFNDIFPFTIVMTNTGTITAYNTIITDTLPVELTYQSGTLAYNRAGQPLVNVPDPLSIVGNVMVFTNSLNLGVGEAITYTFDVQLTSIPAAGSPIWNVVETDASNLHKQIQLPNTPGGFDNGAGTGDDGLDAQEPIEVLYVDLILDKDDGGIITEPGGTIVYTLTYTNVGTALATGVVVTDTVPDNTTFNAAESLPTAWNCLPDNSAGSICTTAVADVPPAGGTGQVFFAVTVDNPLPAGVDTILNAAVVGDDGRKGPDPTPENNRDNEETPLRGNLRLGNRIWLDTNENGLLDEGETGPEGVVIELYRQGAASNFELFALTETSDDGEYGFSDLPAGNYYVLLTAQNFSNSQSPLYNQVSSDPIVTDANTNIDNDNNGLQATDPLSTGIRSSLVALAVGTEPTGEAGEDGLVPDNNSNLTIDFALRPSSGTAVDLLYFQGVYRNGQVDLTWETAIEYDNFGFRLLRSETGDLADAVEIASVPGKGYGTQNGAVYDYTDNAVASKRVYTYWLIDVDLNGIETTHQPVVIVTNNGIFLPLVRR